MVSLRLECSVEQKDELIAALWEDETQGVTEIDLNANRVELRAFFAEQFDAAAYAAFDPRWEEEPDVDWAAETRARWASDSGWCRRGTMSRRRRAGFVW
jgi:hypothetical protein